MKKTTNFIKVLTALSVLVPTLSFATETTETEQSEKTVDLLQTVKDRVDNVDLNDAVGLDQKYNRAIEIEKKKTALLEELNKQKQILEGKSENVATSMNVSKAQDSTTISDNGTMIGEDKSDVIVSRSDNVQVTTVYGLGGNLFATIKINGYKYDVTKGERFGDGYQIKDINKYGVKLSSDGVETFYPVGGSNGVEGATIDNRVIEAPAIQPYELR